MGKNYQVKVVGIDRTSRVIDLCSTSAEFNRLTVKDLKKKIMQAFPRYCEDLCIISVNQRMDDDNALLSSYGIQHLSVIQLVEKLRGGGCEYLPTKENSVVGDKTGKNRSMEKLSNFETTGPTQENNERFVNRNTCTVL